MGATPVSHPVNASSRAAIWAARAALPGCGRLVLGGALGAVRAISSHYGSRVCYLDAAAGRGSAVCSCPWRHYSRFGSGAARAYAPCSRCAVPGAQLSCAAPGLALLIGVGGTCGRRELSRGPYEDATAFRRQAFSCSQGARSASPCTTAASSGPLTPHLRPLGWLPIGVE